jgi:hypothetical protein
MVLIGKDADPALLAKGLQGYASQIHVDVKADEDTTGGIICDAQGEAPTEEEKTLLRRVHGKINASSYVLCFVDGANNASYYGVTGVFTNFIQRPLPTGGNGAVSCPYTLALIHR